MQAVSNYNLLIDKIDTFIRRYYLNKLTRGLIFLGAMLFSGFVLITISEYLGNFNTLLRTILFFGYILLNLGVLIWLVLPPLLAFLKLGSTISHTDAAQIIGKHFTHIQDKLLNTLQLKRLSDENPAQRALIEASIDQKILSLKPVSFPSAVRIKENAKHLKWVLIPFCIIVVLAFTAPSILKDSTERLIKHNQYFAPKWPFQFVITNARLSAIQGGDFKLDLKLTGDQFPNDIYLQTGNNTFKLDKENISRFHYLFSNLQQNIKFRLVGNNFESGDYEITVNLKPSLLHFDVNLQYPAYIHKRNETLNNAGDLTVPAGTTVKWAVHTQNANEMLFEMSGRANRLQSSGNTFLHNEYVTRPGIYTLKAGNKAVTQGDSATYRINVITDQPPVIMVDEKQDSVSSKAIYFNGKVQDDYGFSALTFNYAVNPHNGQKPRLFAKPVKADLNANQAGFFYFWNLKELGAKPGDEVSYYFEVADNNAVTGAQKARTAERTLHMPTEKELNEQLDASTQSVKQKMQSAIKLAAQVEKDAKKLNELLLNKDALSFDEKKQVEDLLQKRKELENLVQDFQKVNQQNLLNRQENKKENQDILEKQKQIEKLFNNVLDEKTRELLKNLQKMLEQNQKDAAQDQLSKMQTDNKSLKKELNRMLELYKQLEVEQKLKDNVDQLNKLADQQQKLADETKHDNSNNPEALLQKQDDIKKSFNDVKKSLNELKDKNGQLEQKTDFDEPKADEQKIDEQLDKSADELNKNSKAKAAQSQQQSAKQMQALAQKLQQAGQEGEEKDNEINTRQLRELIKNLVNNSFDQEKTMQTLKQLDIADPAYISWAQKQKDIKDNIKNVEDSLYSLSKRVSQIQSTVTKEIGVINSNIEEALTNLGDRHTGEANRNQQYAMTSMNNLALMLAEALDHMQDQMKNARSGKGKKKQPSLSQLGQMQQKLNENMQKMREQMQQQGNKGSQAQQGQMSEQFAKMAREQQMIRQDLQQINNQENKDGASGLGNLDNISKEMEQTEKDLVNRRVLDETIKRQQQIRTRLLEAEKADQEREQDQQRESKAGKDMPPGYIKALQTYERMKTRQTEQVHTVSPMLNYYYKSKIKIYFDQINGK